MGDTTSDPMKAVVCENAELEVTDLPAPEPDTAQALIDVTGCGICGSDSIPAITLTLRPPSSPRRATAVRPAGR
jgi:hypothetical protein